jgi:hypothetical protein
MYYKVKSEIEDLGKGSIGTSTFGELLQTENESQAQNLEIDSVMDRKREKRVWRGGLRKLIASEPKEQGQSINAFKAGLGADCASSQLEDLCKIKSSVMHHHVTNYFMKQCVVQLFKPPCCLLTNIVALRSLRVSFVL